MRKAGGNWVDGDRFFDREAEVEALIERVHDGRHTLLTAQRRMGKTSLVRETLRRLKEGGQVEPLFVDLEDAMAPEDVVAEIAAQTLSAQGRWLPIKRTFANFLEQAGRRIEELGFADLKVKLRSGIDGGNWKQRGEAVFAALADHGKPVVLAIDELPILVNRLLKGQDYRLTPETEAGRGRVPGLVTQGRAGTPRHMPDHLGEHQLGTDPAAGGTQRTRQRLLPVRVEAVVRDNRGDLPRDAGGTLPDRLA